MNIKRPNRQAVWGIVKRKGRLLCGAVFLFCSIGIYGWHVGALHTVFGHTSAANTTSTIDTHNRGYELTEGKQVTDDGEKELVSVANSQRAWPLENPFDGIIHHGDTTESMSMELVPLQDRGGEDAAKKQRGISELRVGDYVQALRSRTPQALQGDTSTLPKKSVSSSRNKTVTLQGIVTGGHPVALLCVGEQEEACGVGEGVGGVRIVSITDTSVVIADGTGTRRIYL